MNTPAVFVLMCLAQTPTTNYSASPAPTNNTSQAHYSISEDRLHHSEIACLDRRDAFEHEKPDQRGRCKCQPFDEAPRILPGVSSGDPVGGTTLPPSSANASLNSGHPVVNITLPQPGANARGYGAPRSVSPN